MTNYDKDGDPDGNLNIIEFAKYYTAKFYDDDKCTKDQIQNSLPNDVTACATVADCWEEITNPATGMKEWPPKN